MAGVFSWPR